MSTVKYILLFFLSVLMVVRLIAQQAKGISELSIPAAKDTSIITVNTPVTDPKQGFKDLFIENNTPAGINITQLNPRAVSFVQDYITRHSTNLKKLKGWGRPYFDLIDGVLIQHSLPRELKYLAVIESHLKTYAVSWAGAVGPWQFMPATARRMGLRVNNYFDERTDYFKSTHAAARHLTELFKIYNDWLLVIAAYNGGAGIVNSAIRRSGSRDFWTLQYFLPSESREHVKKFIATHYIFEGVGGITTVTREEAKDLLLSATSNPASKNLTTEEMDKSKVQNVSGRYNSLVIVKHLVFSLTEFNRYNPDFDRLISANGNYEMRLPADKMNLFTKKKYDILNESLQVLLDSFRFSLENPVNSSKKRSK